MTRFDAPEYVQTWERTGQYPAIHNAISNVAIQVTAPGERILDLGCSTGLLGRQMADNGRVVAALDSDARATGAGIAAGVFRGIQVLTAKVEPRTMGEVLNWIRAQGPTTVLARRIFPELHDALGTEGLATFALGLRHIGVSQIVLEGRMPSNRMTHPLCTADREVAALAPTWTPTPIEHPYAHVRVLHPSDASGGR